MKNIALTDKISSIFDDTITWYEKQRNNCRSEILLTNLEEEIRELKSVKELAITSFQIADKYSAERELSRNRWNENLENQKKALVEMEANFPKQARKESIKQYEEIIETHKLLILGTEKSIRGLENLWKTQEDISIETKQDLFNVIELSVSLKINVVTFNRVFESSRTIITSIPGISNIVSLINGTYDLVKIWLTPIKNTKDTDAFLLWLERRRDILKDLKRYIRAFKPFC